MTEEQARALIKSRMAMGAQLGRILDDAAVDLGSPNSVRMFAGFYIAVISGIVSCKGEQAKLDRLRADLQTSFDLVFDQMSQGIEFTPTQGNA